MTAEPTPGRATERSKLQVCLQETIPGDVDAIAPLVERIVALAEERGAVPGHEAELSLALTEALANAVRYGARSDPAKSVTCTVSCGNPRGILIVVRDPGPGFDPASIPNPMEGAGLLSDHGRGLHLIRHLMDEVRWERGGTEIHMWKA